MIKQIKYLFAIVFITFIAASCDALLGEEVARIPVDVISSDSVLVQKETTLDLKAGDEITFWSDVEISYDGFIEIWWQVSVIKDDMPYENIAFDPLDKDITINGTETEFNGKVETSYTGRNYKMTIGDDGSYTFKSSLHGSNPLPTIGKAHLVIRRSEE